MTYLTECKFNGKNWVSAGCIPAEPNMPTYPRLIHTPGTKKMFVLTNEPYNKGSFINPRWVIEQYQSFVRAYQNWSLSK